MFTGMLIGKMARIVESSDLTLLNRFGLILDETKNTLIMSEDSTRRLITIPKAVVKISIQDSGRGSPVLVRGLDILSRPEERIKG